MRMKLTEAALIRYQPKTARDEIFDIGKDGLGVRVSPTGKSFFLIRRLHGRKVRFDIGRFMPTEELAELRENPGSADISRHVSLAEARKKAADFLVKIAADIDPRDEIRTGKKAKAEAAENTFAAVVTRFMARPRKEPLSERTIESHKWALQGEITKRWAARPISEITDADVIKIIDRLEDQRHHASARQFRSIATAFFEWAKTKKLIRENPAKGAALDSGPKDFKRERVLPLPEIRAVLAAADALVRVSETAKGKRIDGQAQRAFVHALALLGQRRTETALMKWSDLTLEGDAPSWHIPAENAKTKKAHDVPLPAEAVEILNSLPRLSGPYVFSTTGGEKPLAGFSQIKDQIDKRLTEAGVELAPWRFHDLRRSLATGMGEKLGIAPHVIDALLAHALPAITGVYLRTKYPTDARLALSAWARLVTAQETAGNVVPLRAGA